MVANVERWLPGPLRLTGRFGHRLLMPLPKRSPIRLRAHQSEHPPRQSWSEEGRTVLRGLSQAVNDLVAKFGAHPDVRAAFDGLDHFNCL